MITKLSAADITRKSLPPLPEPITNSRFLARIDTDVAWSDLAAFPVLKSIREQEDEQRALAIKEIVDWEEVCVAAMLKRFHPSWGEPILVRNDEPECESFATHTVFRSNLLGLGRRRGERVNLCVGVSDVWRDGVWLT
jgi:hypothetical protein